MGDECQLCAGTLPWLRQPRHGETHFKVPETPVLEISDPWHFLVRNEENYGAKRAPARVEELKTMGMTKEGCADGFLPSTISSKQQRQLQKGFKLEIREAARLW